MADYTKLDEIVDGNRDVILDMADTVWNTPELGFHELKSSSYEGTVLADHGFKISDRGIGGIDTSWLATSGSGSPVIGIMVEFDALPGLGQEPVPTKTPRKDGNTNGHGCGHNLIDSDAIGAAISLKGTVTLLRLGEKLSGFHPSGARHPLPRRKRTSTEQPMIRCTEQMPTVAK